MERVSNSVGGEVAYEPGSGLPLPREIREEIPPQDDFWHSAPGDIVWQYTADPDLESLGRTGLSWQVRKLVPGKHFEMKMGQVNKPHFEASSRYRAVVYQGSTPEEALAALLKGHCLLSREGAINPNDPYAQGSPPIQHAVHILTERLVSAVERRKEHLVMGGYAENPAHVGALAVNGMSGEELGEQLLRAVARDNEVVSALATAIAALARVKDL